MIKMWDYQEKVIFTKYPVYKEVCVKKKTDINTFIKTYLQKSKPLFEKYIKPSKRFADVIIP